MMAPLRIGTRESQLAVWQATWVQNLLAQNGVASELVYIKSEGDIDTVTPLYELGVTGVFTKALDAALLNNRIDVAVHSMKDVPTILAQGICHAAVLPRASHKDVFVFKTNEQKQASGCTDKAWAFEKVMHEAWTVATSSIRRKAQWLHRHPSHRFENLRGNVNTRLRKLAGSHWAGAIFAEAGLERIGLKPAQSVTLDWMLPAPAQGAVLVVCRENDAAALEACQPFHDAATALCVNIERDFLRTLAGGCSTPISALATIKNGTVQLQGNICSPDGSLSETIHLERPVPDAATMGIRAANDVLQMANAQKIIAEIRNAKA